MAHVEYTWYTEPHQGFLDGACVVAWDLVLPFANIFFHMEPVSSMLVALSYQLTGTSSAAAWMDLALYLFWKSEAMCSQAPHAHRKTHKHTTLLRLPRLISWGLWGRPRITEKLEGISPLPTIGTVQHDLRASSGNMSRYLRHNS